MHPDQLEVVLVKRKRKELIGQTTVKKEASMATFVLVHGGWHGCRLTNKSAKRGGYASEEENGEDICQ